MIIQVLSNDYPMIIQWLSNDYPWLSNDYLMIIIIHDYLMTAGRH